MAFAYGFNHAAAIASFREAQKRDPSCAMCWWGESLAYGPNINAPLTPDANGLALKAIARAQELSANVTPPERALIMALAKRYSADPNAKRENLDGAYADAMLMVARYYPQHDDISLLAAESAMDTLPWNYGMPKGGTPSLGWARPSGWSSGAGAQPGPSAGTAPLHPPDGKWTRSKARGGGGGPAFIAPRQGRWPSRPYAAHIYYRLGRWKDSIRVNLDAARQDEAYIRESNDKGYIRYGYYPQRTS
jgi:hypothetical protein